MNYREVEILAPRDLGAAGTEVIDIKVKDPLSSLELIWTTTVNTAAVMTATHLSCLSKIELVDGSTVLFSLSGEEAQALAFYHMGKMPLNSLSLVAGEKMVSVIPILFGRKLFDKQLALDPTKFANLQLKVTWDEDAANAGVTVNELTVRGWAFDELAIVPVGMLMSKEIKSYTPVANSFEYTDLPTDYKYRLIIFRSKSDDKDPGEVLNQFKLSEDHDKRIPIDMTGDEIARKLCVPFGEIQEYIKCAGTVAAHTAYVSPTYWAQAITEVANAGIAAGDTIRSATIANNKVDVAAQTSTTTEKLLAKGYCPHSCLCIPVGDPMDIDDFYDVTKLGSLRLITQGAAAVGTNPTAQIILQQLRTY